MRQNRLHRGLIFFADHQRVVRAGILVISVVQSRPVSGCAKIPGNRFSACKIAQVQSVIVVMLPAVCIMLEQKILVLRAENRIPALSDRRVECHRRKPGFLNILRAVEQRFLIIPPVVTVIRVQNISQSLSAKFPVRELIQKLHGPEMSVIRVI